MQIKISPEIIDKHGIKPNEYEKIINLIFWSIFKSIFKNLNIILKRSKEVKNKYTLL